MTEWTLYMDESGSAGDRDGHYVLGCLAGSDGVIARITDRFYYLKRGMATEIDPDSWEIHANKIMAGYSPIKTRTERKKLAALEAVVDTICESGVTLFGASVANEPARRHERDASLRYALTFILERFELFLRSAGPESTGRIVSDMMRRGTTSKVNDIFASTVRGHNPESDMRVGRIKGIQYTNSLSSAPTQLADAVAYVIRQGVEGNEQFADMLAKLKGRMWRDGERSGWKLLGAGVERPSR